MKTERTTVDAMPSKLREGEKWVQRGYLNEQRNPKFRSVKRNN